MPCHVCESNSGAARISPGPPIYEGEHWVVEHAYPSALLGWLVMKWSLAEFCARAAKGDVRPPVTDVAAF